MKKGTKLLIVILSAIIIVFLIGLIGFKSWSAKIVKEAAELEDICIDISQVADGTYEGHSEMGPVIVDVKVTVQDGVLVDVELVKHQNGFGKAANAIVEDMLAKNTYDVDVISGATVSSEIIINAVNKALQKGLLNE